jgi:DNA-binding MarR family transcriptional regulator
MSRRTATTAADMPSPAAAGDACEQALRELSPVELGAWRGMLRVHAALVKALDAELLRAHGLPLSSYEVLITLEAAPGRRRRMSELADSVLLSRSGMTRLVDRLEREGLIERDQCTDDGRGWYAVLTDRGAELLANARATHLAGVRERFLGHFGEDELRHLAEGWERIVPGAGGVADLSPSD